MGTSHEDQHTFSIVSRSVLLRMKNISDKSCGETRATHVWSSRTLFRKPRRLWDNVGKWKGYVVKHNYAN